MALTKWRRPHAVKFPGGYQIKVVYWSSRQIEHNLSATGSGPLHNQTLLGYWDVAAKRLVLNKEEPLWQQIETFGHEMVHVANDYSHWLKTLYAEPIMIEAGRSAAEEALDD